MATLEDEIKDLKEKNNELVQKVQYWKMNSAQKENDRIALMKENNELRLKLSRLRNSGGLQARNLDTALQAASEKALSHLVKASAEIAKSMDIAKEYMRERQQLETHSPRWSTLSGTPNSDRKDRIHRVPPTMMGGQPLQPVVALSRTLLNTNTASTLARSPNRSISERALPMHMLQDVYIPLTRIDVSELQNNTLDADSDTNNAEDSSEELGLDDSGEQIEEAQPMSDDEDYEERRLDAVTEEPEDEVETPPRTRLENPLEGPSWLLDTPAASETSLPKNRSNLEPDSTTEFETSARRTPGTVASATNNVNETENNGASRDKVSPPAVARRVSREFSPTVRRRKRTSSPPASPAQHHYSPRPLSSRRPSGRVLKVVLAKMQLEGAGAGGDACAAKRARSPSPRAALLSLAPFDAPSPNGATDSAVIVSETRTHSADEESSRIERNVSRRESRDSQRPSRTFDPLPPRGLFNHQNPSRGQYDQPSTSRTHRTSSIEDQNRSDAHKLTLDDQRLASCDNKQDRTGSYESRHASRLGSHESRDSDSGSGGDSVSEGRTRRNRKVITYKEKPLNRKLRR